MSHNSISASIPSGLVRLYWPNIASVAQNLCLFLTHMSNDVTVAPCRLKSHIIATDNFFFFLLRKRQHVKYCAIEIADMNYTMSNIAERIHYSAFFGSFLVYIFEWFRWNENVFILEKEDSSHQFAKCELWYVQDYKTSGKLQRMKTL